MGCAATTPPEPPSTKGTLRCCRNIRDMTASIATVGEWVNHPLGKMARIALAGLGLLTAMLSLLLALTLPNGTLLVLLGAALAANSSRAAAFPSLGRLAVMTANIVAIVVVAQTL